MLKYFYNLFDKMKEKLTKKGQGMVEYALILAAVAIIATVVLSNDTGLRATIVNAFTNADNQVKSATGKVGGTSGTTTPSAQNPTNP